MPAGPQLIGEGAHALGQSLHVMEQHDLGHRSLLLSSRAVGVSRDIGRLPNDYPTTLVRPADITRPTPRPFPPPGRANKVRSGTECGRKRDRAFGEPSAVLHDPLRSERLAWPGGSA